MNKTELLDRLSASAQERLVLARALDKLELARARSVPAHTPFLSLAEQEGVARLTAACGHPAHAFLGGWEGAEGALDLPGTKVLMKSGRQYPRLLEELDRRGMLEGAAMVENCGLPGQRAFPALGDRPKSTGYFTTILLP